MTSTQLLHQALKQRWEAAGKPPSASEQCLWDMEREMEGSKRDVPLQDVLAEGIDLLEAWIESGSPATEVEKVAIAQAKADIAAMAA